MLRRALSEAPPVVAAALLAELLVPRLGSPLRELPFFFALWAGCSFVWRAAVLPASAALSRRAWSRVGGRGRGV